MILMLTIVIILGAIFILLSDVLAKLIFRMGGAKDMVLLGTFRLFTMRVAWWSVGSLIIFASALELSYILRPLQWWKLRLW
jgi:hypothetical protein